VKVELRPRRRQSAGVATIVASVAIVVPSLTPHVGVTPPIAVHEAAPICGDVGVTRPVLPLVSGVAIAVSPFIAILETVVVTIVLLSFAQTIAIPVVERDAIRRVSTSVRLITPAVIDEDHGKAGARLGGQGKGESDACGYGA